MTLPPLAKIALTKIRLWNSLPSPSDIQFCRLIETLGEKAVFAAEALESAIGATEAETEGASLRVTALRVEADGLIREAFELMNQARVSVLSREQTRILTRAMLGLFDALAVGFEWLSNRQSQISLTQSQTLATILRRSVEQVRLALAGLREPRDRAAILKYCANLRALHQEGVSATAGVVPGDAPQARLITGLQRCIDIAAALEGALDVSPRGTQQQ